MKTKSIVSSFTLLMFTILCSGASDDKGNSFPWNVVVSIVFLALCIFVPLMIGKYRENKVRKRKKEQLEELEKVLNEKRKIYEENKQAFIGVNGIPDKSLPTNDLDFNAEIHVYEKSKKVFILGKEYSFNDIISCTLSDSPRIAKGKMTAITKSNTGDVIGRSIVGDVIGGSAGAIIGGATASKHTEYIQEDDKTIHDYTVIINMDSIAEPIIRIHTGENVKTTNEIVGLMNVIISRKQ